MSSCKINISFGELYDKYSILQIKKEKINNTEKLKHINKEIECLTPLINDSFLDHTIFTELKKINETLWDIEDNIRVKETKNEFDNEFILLARLVYKTNDQRYVVKSKIDSIFNSKIREIKSYS